MATRSAQVPTGYAAFSTLAPEMNSPDVVRMHAPTRNLEYGPGSTLVVRFFVLGTGYLVFVLLPRKWKGSYSRQLLWRQWPWWKEPLAPGL